MNLILQIYDNVSNNMGIMLLIALFIYIACIIVLRRRIISPFEPVHIQIIYLAFAGSWLAYYLSEVNKSLVILTLFYFEFLLIFLLTYRSKICFDSRILYRRNLLMSNPAYNVFFAICVSIVLINSIAVMYASGFQVAGGLEMGERLLLLKKYKILTYLEPPAASFLSVFLYMARSRSSRFLVVLSIIMYGIKQFFLGSKAAILMPFMFIAASFFLYKLDKITAGEIREVKIFWASRLYVLVLFGGTTLLGITMLLISKYVGVDLSRSLSLFVSRLLLSYDHFHYIIQDDYLSKPGITTYSMLLSYSSLILKPLGLISHLPYDNIGEYIGENLLGFDFSQGNNRYLTFPNSHFALELIFSYGTLISLLLFPFAIYCLFRMLNFFESVRYDSLLTFAGANFLLINPFLLLNDGASFVFNCIGLLIIYIMSLFVANLFRIGSEDALKKFYI